MEEKSFLKKMRKLLINKYAITICAFAVILIFIGDHSLLQFGKRAMQVREVKEQIDETNKQILQTQRAMQMLDNTDSLERFARETYLMHAPNEDVYLVEP